MLQQSARHAPSPASTPHLRPAEVAELLGVPPKPGQEAREPSVFDGDTRVLVPLGEFARRMGISQWLAYKLARSGRLPTTRPGKRELYVPMAAARRIEREGLPPEGGEVA